MPVVEISLTFALKNEIDESVLIDKLGDDSLARYKIELVKAKPTTLSDSQVWEVVLSSFITKTYDENSLFQVLVDVFHEESLVMSRFKEHRTNKKRYFANIGDSSKEFKSMGDLRNRIFASKILIV